jgi:hypothetical protein
MRGSFSRAALGVLEASTDLRPDEATVDSGGRRKAVIGRQHAGVDRRASPDRQWPTQPTRTAVRFLRADARTRTADPFITSEVLYQLSYVGNDRAS